MPDFKKMYYKLVGVQCDAVDGLKAITAQLEKAHEETEEMYMIENKPPIEFSPSEEPDE